jgi:hypothetical protein
MEDIVSNKDMNFLINNYNKYTMKPFNGFTEKQLKWFTDIYYRYKLNETDYLSIDQYLINT